MFAASWIVSCSLFGQVLVPAVNGQFGIDPPQAAGKQPKTAAAPKKPPADVVVTIHDERIEGTVESFENGEITIATQPPRKIPLDMVAQLDLSRQPKGSNPAALTLVWIGQDNHDLAQPQAAPGANGIQDIHLQCGGLAVGRKLRQVVIFGIRSGAESRIWALEPGASPFWRVQSQQAAGSTTVDLYIEPPAADAFDQEWEAWLTTDDDQTSKLKVHATTHTDNTLKVVAETPPTAGEPESKLASVLLEGDETIRGELAALDENSLSINLTGGKELKIPLVQVCALWMGVKRPEKLGEMLTKRGESDWLLVSVPDKSPASIDGALKGLADEKLELTVGDENRKVAVRRLLGFVLAARPLQQRPKTFYEQFELGDGQKISGTLTAVKPETLELQTLWGEPLELLRAQVQTVTCRNGKVSYLSDLEPAAVDEAPYFGRARPYRRDRSLDGGPLTLKGTTYRKGLAVHSRSALTYALDGGYAVFQTLVGFDDTAPPGGSVVCRVLADGRELYNNPTLRQSGEPVPLKLSVEGVKQLVLDVDFGEAEDIGDRVIWAGARLFREPPPEVKPVAEAKPAPEIKPAADDKKPASEPPAAKPAE